MILLNVTYMDYFIVMTQSVAAIPLNLPSVAIQQECNHHYFPVLNSPQKILAQDDREINFE